MKERVCGNCINIREVARHECTFGHGVRTNMEGCDQFDKSPFDRATTKEEITLLNREHDQITKFTEEIYKDYKNPMRIVELDQMLKTLEGRRLKIEKRLELLKDVK